MADRTSRAWNSTLSWPPWPHHDTLALSAGVFSGQLTTEDSQGRGKHASRALWRTRNPTTSYSPYIPLYMYTYMYIYMHIYIYLYTYPGSPQTAQQGLLLRVSQRLPRIPQREAELCRLRLRSRDCEADVTHQASMTITTNTKACWLAKIDISVSIYVYIHIYRLITNIMFTCI